MMGTGVSLRLRAVQVIDLKPMEEQSPFDVVEGLKLFQKKMTTRLKIHQ